MALSLEEYADELANRKELIWPKPPTPESASARPGIKLLPGVKCVLWNVYGTLLNIFQGEILFQHPKDIVMDVALDKTIQEFKMWASMSRKPGQPSAYMKVIYDQVMMEQMGIGMPGGEKFPEKLSEKVWESIVNKLFQKDYKFDVGHYGSLNEYSKKIAYFFHASLQGTAAYPGGVEAVRTLSEIGIRQGLFSEGQCFTPAQVRRAILNEEPGLDPDLMIDRKLRILSCEVGARKPSDRMFKKALEVTKSAGLQPEQVLFVSNRLEQDLGHGRKVGFRTALFVGDKSTLQAKPEQLKDPNLRPDLLLTRLDELPRAFTG